MYLYMNSGVQATNIFLLCCICYFNIKLASSASRRRSGGGYNYEKAVSVCVCVWIVTLDGKREKVGCGKVGSGNDENLHFFSDALTFNIKRQLIDRRTKESFCT